ncbi:unnamed protein product, partial [Gulo gulo]
GLFPQPELGVLPGCPPAPAWPSGAAAEVWESWCRADTEDRARDRRHGPASLAASSATSRKDEKATEAQGGKPCWGHPLLNLPPVCRPQAAPSHAKHRAGSPHTLASTTYTHA